MRQFVEWSGVALPALAGVSALALLYWLNRRRVARRNRINRPWWMS